MELTLWLPICRMRLVDCGSLDHLGPFGMGVDHRLLAVHVLAGFHGIDGNLLVPVIGRANDHRVNIFARQDFLVVARGENVVAPELLAVLETAVVTVGDRDELHPGTCTAVRVSP